MRVRETGAFINKKEQGAEMSNSSKAFRKNVDDLTSCLQASAAAFIKRRRLGVFSSPSLTQMTTPIAQVSAEILMFGADVWPDHVQERKREPAT
jgi:hypothetical protein